MPQPSSTAELLLREVADLLIEIRDLLQGPQPDQDQSTSATEVVEKPTVVRAPRRSRQTTKT